MELLQGTLDMLVLKALEEEARHGYGVMRWLKATSEEDFAIEEGALYPALHRLEERGWVSSDWGLSENRRRARFYQLTPQGRRRLQAETDRWLRYVSAVGKVLQGAA
jgi:transcriptional regulator